MRTIVATLALLLAPASAYQQAFVVREAKGASAPFLSRELGGKNHAAPKDYDQGALANSPADMGQSTVLALKPNQAIVTRERDDGKFNYVKPGSLFSFQSVFMSPPQRAAWSVTPEQHGPALGWSGKDISGGKSFPVGY